MTKPFRFEKAGPRSYTVHDTTGQHLRPHGVLGSVDRLSPDHATLSPKWRGVTIDGNDVGSHHRTRDAAAQAIVDRIAADAAQPPADAPLSAELAAELVADAQAAHARGMVSAPALSAVVMREAKGQPVGSPHFTKVATTWANAYQAERDKAAAAVLAEPDPEYAHRGDDALRIMGARGDDAALVELDRRRAAERAAWNAQYTRGNKPAEAPAAEQAPTERLEYLRGELHAERISYGELAELQGLAEHIDPGDVELLEAAGVPEHPETETPRRWTVTFTETVTHRAVVEMPDLPDGDDYPDRQAAALLDLARDALGDGAVFVSSSAAFVQADPLPALPETLWLCGECYEQLSRGDLAQCEDGCNQSLDHTGACHPHEHAGDTCTRCGEVGRLTSYDSDNLDCEEYDELVALLALPVCPRCGGRHGVAQVCGGPEDQDPGPWEAPTSLAPAELARLRAVADRARETGAARATDPGAL